MVNEMISQWTDCVFCVSGIVYSTVMEWSTKVANARQCKSQAVSVTVQQNQLFQLVTRTSAHNVQQSTSLRLTD